MTAVSLLALPGRIQSFAPKTIARTTRGPEQVTGSSLMALPGPIQNFRSNQLWIQITSMSLMALPGPIQSFDEKSTTPVPITPPEVPRGKLHGFNKRRLLKYGGKFPKRPC